MKRMICQLKMRTSFGKSIDFLENIYKNRLLFPVRMLYYNKITMEVLKRIWT